ncbi:MAG: DUF1707 SHOCT-like domain-containing protein [Trebonia sp.]
MSPSTTQQWTRRIRYSDQHIRVSDTERNSVAELLGQHYADGRLDQGEFDERIGRTMAAKTRGDLAGLFDDLPETGSSASGPAGPGGPTDPAHRGPRRRGGIARPLLLVLLVLICANFAWHAFTSLFFIQPLVWAFVIVAVILLVNRRRHDR